MKKILFKKEKPKKKPRLSPLFLIAVILLFLPIFYFIFSKFLIINEISIKLNNINCVDEEGIKGNLGILGRNILLINFNGLEDKLKSKYICIKGVNFGKQFPDKVLLQVSGRNPVLVITSLQVEASSSGQLNFSEIFSTSSAQIKGEPFLVDNEGVIYSKFSEGLNLPSLNLVGEDIALGQKMDQEVVQKMEKVIDKTRELNLNVQTLIMIPDKYLVIDVQPRLLFSLEKDVETQLASLQLILDKAKIDDMAIEFIDLRFEKPVVKYLPKVK